MITMRDSGYESTVTSDPIYPTFWKFCLFACLFCSCVVSTHGQTNPLRSSEAGQAKPLRESKTQAVAGHVTLANGDRMPATISLFSNKGIEFGSTLFDETVKLKPNSLQSFGFRPAAESSQNPTGPDFQFWLKSGTRLDGSLISLDDAECVLESPYFGKVVVPIADLVGIKQNVPQLDKTVYTALNWQQLKGSVKPDTQGRLRMPPIRRSSRVSPQIVLPQKLVGAGRFEIDFLYNPKTEFQIRLTDVKNKSAVSIGVAEESLVVESDGELSFGEFKAIHGTKQLTVDWDGESMNVLNELGQSLVKLELKSSAFSVSIVNEGNELKINKLSTAVANQEIVTAEVTPEQMLVKNLSGDWMAAKTIMANDAEVTFKGQEGNEKFKIAEVDQIWFGVKQGEVKPTDDPNAEAALGYACLWQRGQRVVFDHLQWRDNKLQFKTDEFKSPGFVKTGLPAEVFLPNATPPADKPVLQEYELAISGIPFSGSYSQGDVSHPVRWQFFGFLEPVSLNIERKIEIRRSDSTASRPAKDSPDRLLLNDGSIVPCRIGLASEKSLNFESKQVPAKKVPLNEVRCCFFNSNNVQWKKTLTNETVQRALTLPRFAHELAFEHILIGKNSDLLRGNLIEIGKDVIEFESRFETLQIPRKNVVGIVAVDAGAINEIAETDKPVDATPEAVGATTEMKEESDPVIMHVDCGNDFIAVGRYVSLDNEQAVLDSRLLGKLQLDDSGIRQIAFNSRFRDVSALQYFTDWQINTSIEPRWTTETEFAADSNELLNQPAPDFALPMLAESDIFQLSGNQGKLVVINFWETTSKPSVLGIPEYRNVIQKFSPQDVVFVGLNQGETVSTVSKFLEEKKWSSLDIAMDANKEVSGEFKVTGIPHLTVLDRSGVVRFIKVGYSKRSAAELEKQLQKLLAE